MVNDNSMFVRIEQYKEAMTTVDMIKSKIADAESTLKKLQELKNEEEAEMTIWRSTVAELKSKMTNIERTLVKAGSR